MYCLNVKEIWNILSYLLKCDLSDWISQNIPNTKMRVETMQDQLPNPIRFIIDHTSL